VKKMWEWLAKQGVGRNTDSAVCWIHL